MELITVRLLDDQRFLKKCLPLTWELSLDQMCEYEVLLIFSTLNLEVWHLLICEQLVVLSQDERPLGLL